MQVFYVIINVVQGVQDQDWNLIFGGVYCFDDGEVVYFWEYLIDDYDVVFFIGCYQYVVFFIGGMVNNEVGFFQFFYQIVCYILIVFDYQCFYWFFF